MELSQKNVVYVGGSGGIGSATCRRLVQKKVANLAILDLVENVELIAELKALNPSTNVLFLKVDLRCKENVKQCFDEVIAKMGHIDILVNGSGVFNEVDAEITIGINLLGVIHSTLAALPLMDKSTGNRGGLIVNIASVAGLDPQPRAAIYAASKAGVVLFTRSLAEKDNFLRTGVGFVTICPGITRTPLLDQFTSKDVSPSAEHIKTVFNIVKNQGPDDCAKNIIQAIETNKNGATYICDVGEISEVTHPRFWNVPR